MNQKKPAAAKTEHASPYALTPQMLEAIKEANDLIEQRALIAEAVEKTMQDTRTAEAEYHAAAQAQANAEADLALSKTEAEDVENEKIANAAADETEKKRRAMNRIKRVTDALCAKAAEVDQKITEFKTVMNMEKSIFTNEVIEKFMVEVEEAIKPLVSVLLRARALNTTLSYYGLGSFMNITITDPRDPAGFVELLNDRYLQVNGVTKTWESAWQEDPEQKALVDSLAPIREIQSKLNSHANFVHPDKRPKPYVRKGYTIERDYSYGDQAGEVSAKESPGKAQELNMVSPDATRINEIQR